MQYEIGRTSLLGNREKNQDRIGVIETEGGVVLVLGDGLGGKPGGEFASQVLVDTAELFVKNYPLPASDPANYLKKMILSAHHAIRQNGLKQVPPVEPGSTAVVCLIQQHRAWWAHVGDSRFYLFRDGLPLYRTQDHSYVEKLYQDGLIPIEKRQGHPMRNIITQCIGLVENEPEITVNTGLDLQVGDTMLLCSDGFWEPLDDAQIGSNLIESGVKDAVYKLALRAEQNSYPRSDNTTALALSITSLQEQNTAPAEEETLPHISDDPLHGAIREIEMAIEKYADEMKKD